MPLRLAGTPEGMAIPPICPRNRAAFRISILAPRCRTVPARRSRPRQRERGRDLGGKYVVRLDELRVDPVPQRAEPAPRAVPEKKVGPAPHANVVLSGVVEPVMNP